jgi:2-succinyl-6-hydroxy-2,4-cyclohexadiene-1-carboxylate synthase
VRCALLHGFAGDPACWDDVVANWQLPEAPLAIALPGHGGGPVLDTWQDNLDSIAFAVSGCDVVVGYSLGARVALGLVAAGQCAFGVLIGCNPGIADTERAARRAFDATWTRILRTDGIAAFIDAWERQPLFATQVRAPARRRAERRARRLALDPEQLAQSLEAMGLAAMPDYWSAIPAHRDRLALVVGADDTKYVAIAQSLPAKIHEVIADSGHDPTLEQPEMLAAVIARAVVQLR